MNKLKKKTTICNNCGTIFQYTIENLKYTRNKKVQYVICPKCNNRIIINFVEEKPIKDKWYKRLFKILFK